MKKAPVYSLMILLTVLLAGCSQPDVKKNIQKHLDSHYKKYRLTVVETVKLPYNNHRFWATDDAGVTVAGKWYTRDKSTDNIDVLYKDAARRHSITAHIKAWLERKSMKVDIYTGETEEDIVIYCMEKITGQNKRQIMDVLRKALENAAAVFTLPHYQASIRFTWQGSPPEGRPQPYQSPGSYYNTWLFAGLSSGVENDIYFYPAGKYLYTTIMEKLYREAIGIDNTVYSAPLFLRIEQENLSELFVSFRVRPEKPGTGSMLFLEYDITEDSVREYRTVTVPLPGSDAIPDTVFAGYIPPRFY